MGKLFSWILKLNPDTRQGELLSPTFFAFFFINDVLVKLNKSVLGSFIHSLCFNAFMYADDIILLSISIEDIQKMLDIYNVVFKSLEMSVNTNKSVCIRV